MCSSICSLWSKTCINTSQPKPILLWKLNHRVKLRKIWDIVPILEMWDVHIKVGQAASLPGCLQITSSSLLRNNGRRLPVPDSHLCSSGTVQPQRGAGRPGRHGGERRVAGGAKGPPVHHARRGRADHGCLQPERRRSVAVCCLRSVVFKAAASS